MVYLRALVALEAYVSILSIVFPVAAILVALYGANALLLAALYLRDRRRHGKRNPGRGAPSVAGQDADSAAHPSDPATWPVVTVQLPLYNELFVVKRLIDAVACLEYPRTQLQIQVLDDSTDETTRLAQARVAHHRAKGLDIELLHRQERCGFKAGALAAGLEAARGEFIVIFDADFVPPPDFLRRTIPHIVAEPRLGFLQTRWGYLNADYSALTRAQTIALDGHFVVEHLGRNRSGLLMNFNGTAGVWRREAIEAAGGWQSDTLTEDLDLSFRAQLAGWQALYLPEIEAPAELPPQIAAFKRQQARWATGAAQCLVKLARPLWQGTLEPATRRKLSEQPEDILPSLAVSEAVASQARLSWPARLEGLLHLSVWIAHPMSLLLLFLTLPLLLGQIPLTLNLTVFWLVALGPTFSYALSQEYLYPDWKRRMLYMPVLALLGTGLALSNTLAIAKGLRGRAMPFRRTPKFHIERQGDRWIGNRYALPFDWVTIGELALAGYALATIGVALYVGNYFSVPFLLLWVGGYGYLGLQGLREAWIWRRTLPHLHHTPVAADSQPR
jgi:cellulose synthase/poly-beta-1,6-N-acetylglucosamine synthase-like glycosyltransferase